LVDLKDDWWADLRAVKKESRWVAYWAALLVDQKVAKLGLQRVAMMVG
jgi:hypothetical protein